MSVDELLNLGELPGTLGCKMTSLPTSYLGLPLGAKYISKSIWDPVIDRLERRMSSWKVHYFCRGGKLVLVRSVLLSLPL